MGLRFNKEISLGDLVLTVGCIGGMIMAWHDLSQGQALTSQIVAEHSKSIQTLQDNDHSTATILAKVTTLVDSEDHRLDSLERGYGRLVRPKSEGP